MKKESYASPDFRFREMFMFEGVADTCWGFHEADFYIFYDPNHNDTHETNEPVIYNHTFIPSEGGQGNGCSNVTTAIQNAMDDIGEAFRKSGYGRYWTQEIQNTIKSKENVGESSKVYIPVHS